jgi:hypothetical protein
MKKVVLTLVFTLAMPFAFAAEHDHDEFPEGTLLALEGVDAISGQECALFVMDVSAPGTTEDQFYAKVLTSYAHGDDAPEAILIKPVAGKPGVLAGTGSNGKDQLALFLDPTDLNLQNAKSFNLKWLHGTHFHTNRCVRLQIHEH